MNKAQQKTISQCFCPFCGKEALSIHRNKGRPRERGHRKWLYCAYCKCDVNTYECRTDWEAFDFRAEYKNNMLPEQNDPRAARAAKR